jgi:hypothetical protein
MFIPLFWLFYEYYNLINLSDFATSLKDITAFDALFDFQNNIIILTGGPIVLMLFFVVVLNTYFR